MTSKTLYIYIPFFLITLIFSYILKFDISNGGSSRDLYYHWNYIEALRDDLSILLKYNHSYKSAFAHHYPLHHIIISRFEFLSINQQNYLNFFFLFSLILPIIFFICLNNRFPEIDFKKKIFISSLIYFLPNYQSSAIWGNSHITSLIFFLLSVYFLINIETDSKKKINTNIFFVVFFMACAAYVRQYYVIFFPFLFLNIIFLTKLKNIIVFCLLSLILCIPGVLFFYNNPILFQGFQGHYTDFRSSILVVLSIIFVYLAPFFISNLKNNWSELSSLLKEKKFLLFFLIFSILFLFIIFNFNYNGYLGGGFFFKISKVFIGNNILFFISAFGGMLFGFYFFRNRIQDIFLLLIICTSFSVGYAIFQKYFEPMILIIIFLFLQKDLVKRIFNFNVHILFFYFLFYWISYFVYSANLIKKMHYLLPQIGPILD